MPVTTDRVCESSSTTGTGAFALAGAYAGFRTFSAAIGDGKTCWYCIESVDASGVPNGPWEVGLGTVSGGTLSRDSLLSSSTGSAVDFAAGMKRVFATVPAAARTYTHVQGTAASVWNVTHSLGKNPSVSVVDSSGTVFFGDVHYIDENSLTITFTAAFGGKAFCN